MPDVHSNEPHADLWQKLSEEESLTQGQIAQFRRYQELLTEWNARMNLTAITGVADSIEYHFRDSLSLGHALDLSGKKMVADVGTGAGFPGIPLKIKYPHLHVVLIEVVQKKIKFLQTVFQELGLTNIEVVSYDWLTFLRTSKLPIELFCARASLAPELLIAMFSPWCSYKKAVMVYWASSSWTMTESLVRFLEKEVSYTVGQKQRKLVFFRVQGKVSRQRNVTDRTSKRKGSA
jgi:16S rRNA (guanine527-N7)-methyltransferase